MKQGHASRSGMEGGKVEPRSHAIRPAGAAQIGVAIDPKSREAMHSGRGFTAPKDDGKTIHHCGSQGRR